MSLINEALNRLEQEKSEEKPQQKSYPFSAPVKNLYDGNPLRKEPVDTNNEYEQHDSSNNSGLAGAIILGIILISVVTALTYYSLPKGITKPSRVKASAPGDTKSNSSTLHQTAERKKTITPKPRRKSFTDALRDTLIRYRRNRLIATNDIRSNSSATNTHQKNQHAETHSRATKKKAKRKFTLGAILASDSGVMAIINNQMVTLGDEIDGAKVIEIGKHHVILLQRGKRIILRL